MLDNRLAPVMKDCSKKVKLLRVATSVVHKVFHIFAWLCSNFSLSYPAFLEYLVQHSEHCAICVLLLALNAFMVNFLKGGGDRIILKITMRL